jgi:hypothetical protein
LLAQHFEPRVFDLQDLLLEERRHILSAVIEDILGRFEGTYRMLVDENKKLMNYLLKASFPMPHAFRLALESVLGRDLHKSLMEFSADETHTAFLKRVHSDAKTFSVVLNWEGVGQLIQNRLESHMSVLAKFPSPDLAERCLSLLSLAEDLELTLSLWVTENTYFSAWKNTLRTLVGSSPETSRHTAYRELAGRLRLVT